MLRKVTSTVGSVRTPLSQQTTALAKMIKNGERKKVRRRTTKTHRRIRSTDLTHDRLIEQKRSQENTKRNLANNACSMPEQTTLGIARKSRWILPSCNEPSRGRANDELSLTIAQWHKFRPFPRRQKRKESRVPLE